MELRLLRYFLTVAKEQSFTKSSRTIAHYAANAIQTNGGI